MVQEGKIRRINHVLMATERIMEGLRAEGLYTVEELYKALRANHFPATLNTLSKLEKKGIILPPTERRIIRGHAWRLYTRDRINEIIAKLKTYPQKKVFITHVSLK